MQGPPGTGKTHTIANIICDYLATGRRVLVTSKSEGALAVLRDQIPEGIRDLAISLLTSEREGLKQLEATVNLLSSKVASLDTRTTERDISDSERRISPRRSRHCHLHGRWIGHVDSSRPRHQRPCAGGRQLSLVKYIRSGCAHIHWSSARLHNVRVNTAACRQILCFAPRVSLELVMEIERNIA